MSESKPVVRCAIYTRKSTEEGLEQDFNTLQAQRESAEAYILSQKQAGWCALPRIYNDGGFSGANLERPALTKLLADIEAREIDCVVVYKVDRLSRSLLDFARLLSLFERQNVSFVSVTQDFNTTTSLGRLTLNILLSFAQFEREIISERTRDKMSAARRKGKWMGGRPVLGYDISLQGGGLVVNEVEAAQVRRIFSICAASQSLAEAVREVNRNGIRTKQWTSKAGKQHPGTAFQDSTLDLLIRNPLYKGQIAHKGVFYPGEQPPIVEATLWDRVNQIYSTGNRRGKRHQKVQTSLAGLLYCAACSSALSCRYTWKAGIRHVYYICHRCQKKTDPKQKPVATTDLEVSLLRELEPLLGRDISHSDLRHTVERLSYCFLTRQLSVSLRDGSQFAYVVPRSLVRVPRKASQKLRQRVPALTRMVALAITCQRLIEGGAVSTYQELASRSGLTRGRLSQILLLANLAPDIQEQLLFLPKARHAPDRLFLKDVQHLLPVVDWREQAKLFQAVWTRAH